MFSELSRDFQTAVQGQKTFPSFQNQFEQLESFRFASSGGHSATLHARLEGKHQVENLQTSPK